MILLSVRSRCCGQIQKRKMATRLGCSSAFAGDITSLVHLRLEKSAAAERPRGSQHLRYHLHLRQKKHPRNCLNLTISFAIFWALCSFLGAGRYLTLQPAIQEGSLSFVFCLIDEPYFPKGAGSHTSRYIKLFALLFSALFAWASPRITALARELSGDHRLPKSSIVHACEHYLKWDRVHRHRTTFLKAIVSCIGCLTLGVLAALLLRSSGTHHKQPDIYLGAACHTREQCQDIKRRYLRTLATILIAPFSSNQTTTQRKIVKCFNRLFNIGRILEMDVPISTPSGVYQPAKHHSAEAKALKLRDLVSEDRGNIASIDQGGEDTSPDAPTPFGRSTITRAPDPEQSPFDKSNQARRKVERQAEPEGTPTLSNNFYPVASSSNTTSPASTPTRDLGPTDLSPQESTSSPSSGPNRIVVKKTRSSIFRHGSSQADTEIPPMPQQGFFSRATSSILRRNPNRREISPLVADRPTGNEKSSSSSPDPRGPSNVRVLRDLDLEERARAMGFDLPLNRFGLPEEILESNITPASQAPTDVRLVRDLGMEEKAKSMGYTLPQNRFGLHEEIVRYNTIPTESEKKVSSDAGTMVGLVTSEDDHYFADDEVTVLDDAEPLLGDHGIRSPPTGAKFPVTETEGGQEYLQESPSYSMSWLADCFTPSNIDLLKDLGTPPRAATHSPHSSPMFTMADETRHGLHNLGAPSTIGDFNPYEAEHVHNSWPDQSQQEQDHANEVNKLRGEIRKLIEKFSATCKAKDSEIQSAKTSEAAAVERVKALEKILEFYDIACGGVKELSEDDSGFDLTTDTFGGHETPTKPGFTSTSKGSNSGNSSGNQFTHKKSKSQEGGFFKGLIGTTEPSLSALEKLTERTLLEANVSSKDPDLAAKLGVSSRQLPPEAPKPASKDPVPKAKSGPSSMLRRLSLDNLKRKDTKSSGSSDSKNYSTRNTSQNSHYSQTKDVSLTSITEESSSASKSPETESSPPSSRDKVASFSEDSSSPANNQHHSRSSGTLTGQYDSDLSFALTALKADRSPQQGSGAIPQGWEYMGVSRDRQEEECNEPDSVEEEYEGPIRAQEVPQTAFDSSVGALAHGDHGDQALRYNPPSRSPPARPGLQTYSTEGRKESFEGQEACEEQHSRPGAPKTPERLHLNKSLPEINPEEVDKDEVKKDGKKRGLRNLFTRK